MSRFEKAIFTALGTTLLVSATMAYARGEEEFARRAGLKGTKVIPDLLGRNVEYTFSRDPGQQPKPVLLLENGLGSPLESWDWIEYLLRGEFDVLRYHRRGYARTKSRLRPAEIVEHLLRAVAPTGPVVIASHSLGALVTANMLAESSEIAARTATVVVVDGTDATLLEEDRRSPRRASRFRQLAMQEALAEILGVNRWVPSKFERDVEYRPDVQRAFVTTTTSVRTQIATVREYRQEPTVGQAKLAETDISVHVIAASDNTAQQESLASQLGARFTVVPASSHRSIIGKLQNASQVAHQIREAFRDA